MPFLLVLLLFIAVPLLAADDAACTINADWIAVKGPTSRVWQNCIGAGRANEGLRSDWQQPLAEVQRDIGFHYICFHGLFHDDMGVYKEGPHGEPIYHWQYVDKLFDFLLSVQIRPFVELGFLPSAMQSDPRKTIFWWNGQIRPPRDFSEWGDLVTALVRHAEVADSMSLWTFTDIFEEPGPQFGPFGLLNLQGIRKPTFYAYKFPRALGPTELQSTDGNSYVCRDAVGNFQVLLWDFAAQPDQAYANAFFSNGDHPEDRGSTQIAVKNVPSGHYRLSIYRTGYGQNDPLDAFHAIGSPQNLSRDQESKSKALSDCVPQSKNACS